MDHDSRHFLLKTAHISQAVTSAPSPQGCHYDMARGAWIVDGTDVPLVDTESYRASRTKKGDIETGEDQKGD